MTLAYVVALPARCGRTRVARFVCSACDHALQSVSNPRVKYVRALQRRKQRDVERKIVLEGHRLVLDAVRAGYELHELFYTADALKRAPSLTPAFNACAKRATLVSEKVMASMSDTVTPQGAIAVIARPSFTLPKAGSLVLLLDSVQDPGNTGTLVRAAAGAGADAVLLTRGCADVWANKTLRAGMGAQLRIPTLSSVSWDDVDRLNMRVCVADGGEASVDYSKVDWTIPSVLVVGSEAKGPSEEARRRADKVVRIPMHNQVESLNAAVAGSVILFEAMRQKSAGKLVES